MRVSTPGLNAVKEVISQLSGIAFHRFALGQVFLYVGRGSLKGKVMGLAVFFHALEFVC